MDVDAEFDGLPRSQFVYSKLKGMMKEHKLVPGQRVREAEIASMLGVSRTPVREAMNRLVSEKLLVLSSTRGISVVELDRQHVLELYATREFVEGASARFAAQHASPAEIASLRSMLEQSRLNLDPQKHAAFNRRFHAAIGVAAHNRYVQQMLDSLADTLHLLRGTTFQVPGRSGKAFEEHLAIITAIENRDPDSAEAAARHHIRNATQVRLEMMFENE